MIKYTPQNQLKLELYEHPFEQYLEKENRWVKLAEVIPWDELALIYIHKLNATSGRMGVDARIVIAAIIIKHKLKLDDRGTIDMIQENIYLQYFCGLPRFTTERVFDPSLFVEIRKRMGINEFDKFNNIVIDESERRKPKNLRIKKLEKTQSTEGEEIKGEEKTCIETEEENENRGTLKVDATVADQEIKYPTDLNLLNESREHLERIIDILYNREEDGKKPRTYRIKARKEYLNLAKKRRKGKRELRKALKGQLQYVRRDIEIVDKLRGKTGKEILLTKRDKALIESIKKLYEQQKWMYDNNKNSIEHRIVNIYQPWVRPIVRGKEKNKTEFGAKINVSEVDGFCKINHLSWEAYNEGTDLKQMVEDYYKQYGCYPEYVLGDQIYLNRANRKYLNQHNIKIVGKPLGRPTKTTEKDTKEKKKKMKKAGERNHVEGKFGQAKRGYHMNNIKARLKNTSESWICAIIFVMNLSKLMEIVKDFPDFLFSKWKCFQNWIVNFFNIKICFPKAL
jgi:transposase, IS5 family